MAVATVGTAAPARAQADAAEAGPAESAEAGPAGEYRRLIALALEEFRARRWAEARALFRRAHALEPNARTLRGIAMTSFELREYAAAIRAIEAALAHPARPLTEAQRAHVLDLKERAEAFVARYELDLAPADARLTIDGVRAEPADGVVTVDLGTHELRVIADGHAPWGRRVRVVGGERERLEVRLAPETTDAPPEPAAAATDPGRDVPAPRPVDRTAAHVFLGAAGVAFVATGVAVGFWVEGELDLGRCELDPCRNVGAIRAERDLALGLSLGFATAVVGLGITGLVLLLIDGDPAGAASSGPCAPHGLGVACRF